MNEPKYHIMEYAIISVEGHILHQIQATRDIKDIYCGEIVRKGDIGGWVEDGSNLSQEGECWIYPGSYVFGGARVEDNARIRKSRISNGSCVCGTSCVSDYSIVANTTIIDSMVEETTYCNGGIIKGLIVRKGKDIGYNTDVIYDDEFNELVDKIMKLGKDDKNKLLSTLLERGFYEEI